MGQRNLAEAGGRVYAVQHGTQYVYNYGAAAAYQVQWFPHAAKPMADSVVHRAPSRLLAARNQVVPFHPREVSTAWLASWLTAGGNGLTVRLMHGAGGQGKTRLAHRFCADAVTTGWSVVVGRHHSDPAAAGKSGAQIPVPGGGLLLLIDYADRWPTTDLLTCLRHHTQQARTPIRALLLARSAGPWWNSINRHLSEDDGIADIEDLALPALANDMAERKTVYRAARSRFAAPDVLNVPAAATAPDPDLSDSAYERVLDLHVRALVDVVAAASGLTAPADPAELTAYLLHRERDAWQIAADVGGPGATSSETMGRAVYLATLAGPLPYPAAVKLLARGQLACTTETANRILDDHARSYPPVDPVTRLGPLYPDRVGEDFLALSTPGHGLSTFVSDSWAAGRVAMLLQPTTGDHGAADFSSTILTVLIEAARRWPHMLRLLAELLGQHPALVRSAGAAALTRLAGIDGIDPDLLENMEQQLPAERDVGWDIAAAAVMQRVYSLRITSSEVDPPQRAKLHSRLGYRLGNAGDREGAFVATSKAVDAYRFLAGVDPAAFTPDLAKSLNNFGVRLSELGRNEEALTATTEAVELRRALVRVDPSAFTPDLAHSLNNLGARFSELARDDEALIATREAVDAYRALVGANAADFTPDLARSLHNLGAMLFGLDRGEEAQTATFEAVELRRALASVQSAAHTPDLADSLCNLGAMLAELDRREEALAAATEAVEAYRALVDANPAAYSPNLAASLNNLGTNLAELDRREEALVATSEAVDVYRALAGANPAAYNPNLATSLNNLGTRFSEVGRRDEALTATTEAVGLRRAMARANPSVYKPKLAKSLNSLGARLSEVNRPEDALAATFEAVELQRALAVADPDAFAPDLADSLNDLAARLTEMGRHEEAEAFLVQSKGLVAPRGR